MNPRSSRTKTSSSEHGGRATPTSPVEPGAARSETPAAERRRGSDRRRPVRIRSVHDETRLEAAGDFARRVYKKADQDQIFFMAGSIAFNVLVAIIPLLLATLGITGQILQKRLADPEDVLLRYILNAIPPVSPEFGSGVRNMLRSVLDKSSSFTIVGIILLVWVSTRLVGTLRAALREVFDVGQDRSIIAGKLFDMKMVLAAGTLFTLNVAFTFVTDLVRGYGKSYFNVKPLDFLDGIYLTAGAFTSAWVMFLLIYRYLPFRRIHWRTAVVAATFTTTFFELLKRTFAWYVANVASYSSTYSNFANLIVLFLWIYYIAIIFILGGEVGQVYALRSIRRHQKQRLG